MTTKVTRRWHWAVHFDTTRAADRVDQFVGPLEEMAMRLKHFIAVCLFVGGPLIVPGLFWISGFDFNVRGEKALLCAILTILVSIGGSVAAVTYPDQ